MKLLVDMNLSPEWVHFLDSAGIESVHWSAVGKATSTDTEIMEYATAHGYVVLTQDLDFGVILASTQLRKPSVVQISSDDLDPNVIGKVVIAALVEGKTELDLGALITVDSKRSRLRVLPFPSK